MDKSWIGKPHNSDECSIGLAKFLDFAFDKERAVGETIRCPCPLCGFTKWKTRDIVKDHLEYKPFPKNYVIWNLHGERQVPQSSRNEDPVQEVFHSENLMETMVNDAFGHYRQQATNIDKSAPLGANEGPRVDCSDFQEFLNDGNQTLHEGSKYTKLEFIIKLYHIKVLCGSQTLPCAPKMKM